MPWLQELRWPQVEEYLKKKDVILIPVGSIEQHGRHAPLGTDSFAAIYLAEDVMKRMDVISAPPQYVGWSPYHMVLPGTITLEPELLSALMSQEMKCLATHGFKNFVLINGHRIGNLSWLQIAAMRAQDEMGLRAVIFDPAYMSKEIATELGFGNIGHAEEIETSHMLYVRPDLIDMKAAVEYTHHEPRPHYHQDPRSTEDTLFTVPNTLERMKKIVKVSGGATGKPNQSTAEAGRRYHEHLVERMMDIVRWMEETPIA